jgi:glycosyltransferase involved in cell wall biosynthesis
MDALAARDLSRHTYLGNEVRVVCPVIRVATPPRDTVAFQHDGFQFVGLPHAASLWRYVVTGRWLRAVWTMWRQLAWPDIAFVGFVEHPIPYGWTAAPFAALRRVPWYTFIESSPWRVPPGVTPKWRHRLRATIAERVNRYLFRRAAFAFVSQPSYVEFLRPGCPYLVSPASWFLRDEVATAAQVEAARSQARKRDPHLMYVGRLDPAKGIDTLLSALAAVDAADLRLTFTVMGAGQLRAQVEQAAKSLQHVRLLVAPTLRYGTDFFGVLRNVDGLVVPNLGDEQPRVVFDAFSQAVPVIASDTSGLRSIVTDGVDGRLTPAGDASALATAIIEFLRPETRAQWIRFGDAGHKRAIAYDHDAMHAQRAEFVARLN